LANNDKGKDIDFSSEEPDALCKHNFWQRAAQKQG